MKKIIFFIIFISFTLAGGFPSFSQQEQEIRFPEARGHVTDKARVISPDAKRQIESMLMVVEDKTTAEVAVLTVKTTRPLTLEQYAVELFQKWGIGKKGEDNGVLILVATGDRKVRIEVGYGLEGALTDAHSNIIINDLMVPHFKKGDYTRGIAAGAVMVSKVIADEYGVDIDLKKEARKLKVPVKEKSSPLGSILTFIFFVLIFGFRFGTLFFFMSGPSRYWSSGGGGAFGGGVGSSGGGFGGFGGGISGGGGASGSW